MQPRPEVKAWLKSQSTSQLEGIKLFARNNRESCFEQHIIGNSVGPKRGVPIHQFKPKQYKEIDHVGTGVGVGGAEYYRGTYCQTLPKRLNS